MNPTPPRNNHAMNSTSLKIAVIGPTQSGKTCLALGLSATSTRGFTIEVDNIACCKYLDDLKVGIAKGDWPSANNKGPARQIRFTFQRKGKAPVDVSFAEFSGELLGDEDEFKDLANQVFRDQSGVVLLVNPGSDAFQKGDERLLADTMSQYKRAISFLKNPNNGSDSAFVALTVTAADRIHGDLAGKLDAFNRCVEEISNTLTTSGFKWKRFDVSVTGKLESQEKPKVARGWDNTASRPFLWILYRLILLPIIVKIAKRLCFAAVAAAAAIGVFCLVDAGNAKSAVDGLERECSKAAESGMASSRPRPIDLDTARGRYDALREWNGRWRREYARRAAISLDPKVWVVHKKAIDCAIDDARKEGSTDNCYKVDSLFFCFTPLTAKAKDEHGMMLADWEDERPRLHRQFASKEILDKIEIPLKALAGQHGEKVMEALFALYGELSKVELLDGSMELQSRKDEVAARLESRMVEELKHQIGEAFDAGLPPEKAEAEVKRFTELLSAWSPMTDEGRAAKGDISGGLDKRKTEAMKKWEALQRSICEDWIKTEFRKDRPLAGQSGLFDAYRRFSGRNADNPFFATIVQAAVYARAEKSYADDVAWFKSNGGGTTKLWGDAGNFAANWRAVEKRISSLRQLCREIASDKTPLRTSWAWHFAQRCINDGKIEKFDEAFPRRIVFDRIDATADYHGKLPANYKRTAFGARIDVRRFNPNGTLADEDSKELLPFASGGWEAEDKSGNSIKCNGGKTEKALLQNPLFVDVHAFEKVELVLVATDCNKGTWTLSSPLRRFILAWGDKEINNGDNGSLFDLSFHLGRWTGTSHPKLQLKVIGKVVDDNSIDVLLEKAKQDAKAMQAGK